MPNFIRIEENKVKQKTTQYGNRYLFTLRLSAFAFIFLALGVLNYYWFGSGIYLFKIFSLKALNYHIPNTIIRHFMTGYFSDACWCCALYLITAILSGLNYLQIQGKVIILLMPFIVEIAQYFSIIPGTFDWYDLLAYGIILLVFIKLFKSLNPICDEK